MHTKPSRGLEGLMLKWAPQYLGFILNCMGWRILRPSSSVKDILRTSDDRRLVITGWYHRVMKQLPLSTRVRAYWSCNSANWGSSLMVEYHDLQTEVNRIRDFAGSLVSTPTNTSCGMWTSWSWGGGWGWWWWWWWSEFRKEFPLVLGNSSSSFSGCLGSEHDKTVSDNQSINLDMEDMVVLRAITSRVDRKFVKDQLKKESQRAITSGLDRNFLRDPIAAGLSKLKRAANGNKLWCTKDYVRK